METRMTIRFDGHLDEKQLAAAARCVISALHKQGVANPKLFITAMDPPSFEKDVQISVDALADDRPEIAIVVERGVVLSVESDRADEINADVLVIDYDTQGADEDDLPDVLQDDGSHRKAFVSSFCVAQSAIGFDNMVVEKPID